MLLESPKFKILTFPWSCLPVPVGDLCHGFYSPGHGHWGGAAWILTFRVKILTQQGFGECQAPQLIMCWEKTGFKELGGITTAKEWIRNKERAPVKLQVWGVHCGYNVLHLFAAMKIIFTASIQALEICCSEVLNSAISTSLSSSYQQPVSLESGIT